MVKNAGREIAGNPAVRSFTREGAMRLLSHLLKGFVRKGRLTVIDRDGARHVFGAGGEDIDVTIRLHDARVEREIFLNPELKTAEAYMDGRLTIEEGGEIFDLLHLFSINRTGLGGHPVQRGLRRLWRMAKRWHQANPVGQAAENVRHHYDIPEAFYRLWLDESMSYTCAYYPEPGLSLEQAQTAKVRHVAAKLKLEPGMRVAELGCGWGGLAIYLAKTCGVRVTACNVSPEQLAVARRTAQAEGVGERIDFVEQDLRDMTGRYDRVVSVGALEHIGVPRYDEFFDQVRSLTAPGGFALVHAIGRMSPPGTTGPFLRKYIFPGGYTPALSEVFASTERTGLWVADCECLRLHYAWTINEWHRRFKAHRDEVVAMLDERFARMWEFYLSAVELGFLHGSNFIFQLLLAEKRDSVPVTRDYITDDERKLARTEI